MLWYIYTTLDPLGLKSVPIEWDHKHYAKTRSKRNILDSHANFSWYITCQQVNSKGHSQRTSMFPISKPFNLEEKTEKKSQHHVQRSSDEFEHPLVRRKGLFFGREVPFHLTQEHLMKSFCTQGFQFRSFPAYVDGLYGPLIPSAIAAAVCKRVSAISKQQERSAASSCTPMVHCLFTQTPPSSQLPATETNPITLASIRSYHKTTHRYRMDAHSLHGQGREKITRVRL